MNRIGGIGLTIFGLPPRDAFGKQTSATSRLSRAREGQIGRRAVERSSRRGATAVPASRPQT